MIAAKSLIVIVFITGFFAGPFIESARYFSVGLEVSIYALLILSLMLKRRNNELYLPVFYAFLIMMFIGVCSVVLNSEYSIRPVFSVRNLYRFYFFFLALVNLDLNESDLKKINKMAIFILLIQLPVVAVKFAMHGISELNIGTYQMHEGSLTAAIPLMAIIYLVSMYSLYDGKKTYIFFAICFLFWAVVGEKRAVVFLLPFVLLLMYFIISKRLYIRPISHAYNIAIGGAAILAIVAIMLTFHPSLNPEGKVGGSVDPAYALEYAQKYDTNVGSHGYTWGRQATMKRTFSVLSNSGIKNFFFGFGPGSFTPVFFDNPNWRSKYARLFKIRYGLTPMSLIAIEYGIFGVIAFSIMIIHFIFMSYRLYGLEKDPYWTAFASGSFGFSILMMYFFLFYHPPIWLGDTFPILFYYCMAVVFIRTKANMGLRREEREVTVPLRPADATSGS